MKRLLILDGNSLLNRAYYALPLLSNKDGIYTNAIYGFSNMLFRMREDIAPDYIVATFDRKAPTFRHEKYDNYKAGRKKMPDELASQIPFVKEMLNLICLKKSNIELDFSNTSEDIFNRCYEAYEKYKRKNNLLDFNDLQNITYNILKKNKNILNYYKRQFKYILVDEFQDCDITQINFLKLINTNIFCVGDEDQCIYSFRGSSPTYMVNFDKEFADAKKIYLKYNYRSSKSVVDLSKSVIRRNKERNDKLL